MDLTDDAKQFLIKQGSNTDYGARPLRRAIESRIEDPLSEELLKGEFEGKNKILVDAVWDENHESIVRLSFEGSFDESLVPEDAEPAEESEETAVAASDDDES